MNDKMSNAGDTIEGPHNVKESVMSGEFTAKHVNEPKNSFGGLHETVTFADRHFDEVKQRPAMLSASAASSDNQSASRQSYVDARIATDKAEHDFSGAHKASSMKMMLPTQTSRT